MKYTVCLFLFILNFNICTASPKFLSIIDNYFAEKGVNWKLTKDTFDDILKEWGYKLVKGKEHYDYLNFYFNYAEVVKPLERSRARDLVAMQLDRLGGFHVEYVPKNPSEHYFLDFPAPWWDSLLHVENRYDYEDFPVELSRYRAGELFQDLKRKSIEGGVGHAYIGRQFSKH